MAAAPYEAEPPLIVDSDAVLAGAVALERLQAISGRNAKVLQPLGRMEVQQLAPGRALDCPESDHRPILKKRFSVMAAKRPDQEPSYDVGGIPSRVMAEALGPHRDEHAGLRGQPGIGRCEGVVAGGRGCGHDHVELVKAG
jgi:hypothetical protein